MEILQQINNLDYWWAIIIVFAILSTIGILIGFVNGWKTALYFLSWNLIGTLIAVLVIDNIFDNIIKIRLEEAIRTNLPFDIDNTSSEQIWYLISFVKDIIILLCVLLCYLATSLLGLFVYFFVRRFLKKQLKSAKNYGNGTGLNRLLGSAIGFVNTLPLSMALAGPATFISRNKAVNTTISYLTQATTFGVVNDISQNTNDIYLLGDFFEISVEFSNIFSLTEEETLSDQAKQNLRENASKLAEAFNSSNLSELAGNLVSQRFAKEEKINFTEEKTNIINRINDAFIDPESDQKITLELTNQGKENLKNVLLKIATNKDTNAINQIIDSLTK